MTETQDHTVLIVDDAGGIVEIYDRWLREEYEVLTAADGEAARSAIDESVDVVLVDRDLPDVTGGDLVAAIHDEGFAPGIVLLSSVVPEQATVGAEYHACLIKPILRRELVEAVERAIEGKHTDTVDPGVDPGDADASGTAEGETAENDRVGADPAESSAEAVTDRIRSIRENLASTTDDIYERSADGPDPDNSERETKVGPEEDPDARTGDGEPIGGSPGGLIGENEEGESLQERVERLARETIELTDGDADPEAVGLDGDGDGSDDESVEDGENTDTEPS